MNVRQKAEALIAELQNGFNGIYFYELKIPDRAAMIKDTIDDGFPDVAEEWADSYVMLSLGANMPYVDEPYQSFDQAQFEYDLKNKLIETFGKECLPNDFGLIADSDEVEVYNREEYETKFGPIFRGKSC